MLIPILSHCFSPPRPSQSCSSQGRSNPQSFNKASFAKACCRLVAPGGRRRQLGEVTSKHRDEPCQEQAGSTVSCSSSQPFEGTQAPSRAASANGGLRILPHLCFSAAVHRCPCRKTGNAHSLDHAESRGVAPLTRNARGDLMLYYHGCVLLLSLGGSKSPFPEQGSS